MRLDVRLIEKHPELSRRKARDVIEKGQVTVGGAVAREPGRAVSAQDDVSWDPNRKALRHVRPPLPLLYADERLLVVDKPPGLLTVPTGTGGDEEETALGLVQEYAARLRPRSPYVGRVHRIDRDTSGAVAFALDSETREALIDLFRRHAIERHYLALVQGEPRPDTGRIDIPIHESYEGGQRRLARGDEPALPAVTDYEVRERLGGAALVWLRLFTGRQHQIRLHLRHLGHPILGDRVYGAGVRRAPAVPLPRQMLHAQRLAFDHPWGEGRVEVDSPLPEDFRRALESLRGGAKFPPERRAPKASRGASGRRS